MSAEKQRCYLTTPRGLFNNNLFISGDTKDAVERVLEKGGKIYWSIPELQKKGALVSQKAWDDFKQNPEFEKFTLPNLVIAYLMSLGINP